MRAPAHHLIFVALLACNSEAPPAAPIAPPPAAPIAPPPAFWVAGTEPFWAVRIDSAGLRFSSPDDTAGIRFPPISPVVTGDTLRWVGRTERDSIEVTLWKGICSDGMSDREWSHTATVVVGGRSYRGCARE